MVHEAFGTIGISDKRASTYTDHLKQYAIDHIEIFNPDYHDNQSSTPRENMFLPWQVNLIVDNSEQTSVPVVVDYDATFEDLVGRIERIGGSGGFVYTNHMMISAGSIASANHGYLLVDAMNMLRNAGSYPALKRILSTSILTIEDLTSFVGMGSNIPLKPMPIPVNVKVIMLGSPFLWSQLVHYDPEFLEYFEKADIAPTVNRTDKEIAALASWTRQYGQLNNLLPFHDGALGKIVEHAGRLADRQDKLSVDFAQLESIVREASYLAHGEQSPATMACHVRRAIENKFYRSNLYYERMQEMVRDQTIILPLKGEAVGQMTLLSVTNLGDIQIGFPGRITAEWSVGRPGFISIHREAGLAGEILKKGELTVQGYLQALFAKRYPMAVNISYNPEQVYGEVDGDSASLALFYAIVSALSDIPLRQDIAITGSMPQRGGHAQAIGGVNEKIEGFFDICAFTGLTGTQGVIIPQANARDLMLAERVVEAVEQGVFAVWAITDATEGIRILTGKEAGQRKPDFTFTENSVYDTVDKQLQKIAENAHNFFEKDAYHI